MPDEIQKAVSGDLNEEQIKDVESKLSDEGKKQLRELLAIKAQRKSEEDRLKKAKSEADEIENKKKKEIEDSQKAREATRISEIAKAKAKFFTDFQIPVEEQSKYSDEEFKKHDSGQVNSDSILKDWVKVYGSINAESLVESKRKADLERIDREKQAAAANAGGAGSFQNNPSGQQPPKFSPEVEKIAKESNISLEAADKIAKEGRHRLL